jgi:hypothetical protein
MWITTGMKNFQFVACGCVGLQSCILAAYSLLLDRSESCEIEYFTFE